MSVGPHKAVFEYDGLYICLDCHSRWGVHVLDYPKEAPGACLAGPAGGARTARCPTRQSSQRKSWQGCVDPWHDSASSTGTPQPAEEKEAS
jgi:hypothetical protein